MTGGQERVAVEIIPFPDDFPHKGQFRTYARDWTPTGYADAPHYVGQMPVTFPTDATPYECFVGGYIRPATPDTTPALGG